MNDLPTLDMTAVTREALGGLKSRAWSLEYLCSGVTFKWAGYATTQQDADQQARQHLDQYANFSPKSAQLIAALEV